MGRSGNLVGRDTERARVHAFIGALPHEARALLIRGTPGIGKTAVWRFAVRACAEAGFEVLVTRPAQDEMPLGLTGLVDLFERLDVDTTSLLAEDQPLARGRAVLAALRRLAADRPVVVAIDDVQWLDVASARALRYAVRRLSDEPVGVLATLPMQPCEEPLDTAGILPADRFEPLDLGPLDLDALRGLLSATVDSISRPALHRIHEVSGGNPLYAIELARGLAADKRNDGALRGLRLPESLQGAIALRLDRVAGELGELLELAAVAGPTSVQELRRLLPASETDARLIEAERQDLLVVDENLRVRFPHPLIASVAYRRIGPLARRALHARLATDAADPEVRAGHLALSTDGPDATVAQLLEDAAERARERGAFDSAAELTAHAVRLTPSRDTGAALRRALAEIEDRAVSGEMSRGLALADALIATLPPGPGRARAVIVRGYLEDDDVGSGVAMLEAALEDTGDDVGLRAQVLDQLGWLQTLFQGDLPRGVERQREAVELAVRARDVRLEMFATAALGYIECLGGTPRPDLGERARALEAELGKPVLWTSPRTLVAEQRLWAGDLPGSRALFEEVHRDEVRTEIHQPYCMFDLALVECMAGNFGVAEQHVRAGIEAARDAEDAWGERLLLYPLALVEAWLGRHDAAHATCERRLAEARRHREPPGIVRARSVLGFLALSDGDADAAVAQLAQAAVSLDAMGFAHPGAFPVLPDAIEAMACSGDLGGAASLLARLDAQAAAVGSPWARATADRSRGAVLAARGRHCEAVAALARAVTALDALGHRPDAARAMFLRGRAMLRGGQRAQAADAFNDARGRFAALGAPVWEARAIDELERTAPGRASGTLTPAERRVAALVAAGKRNREIGQLLFMSVSTVEGHLTRTYRKLAIRSRSELARLMAEGLE
jgi:DNA-binding CsgD family transcriptional regulator